MAACTPSPGPSAPGPQGSETAWSDLVRTDLEHYITGPVIVLDVDHSTLATLCGRPAMSAAQDWQRVFVKAGALCGGSHEAPWRMVCYAGGFEHLFVFFEDEQTPRLTEVIVGDPPGGVGFRHLLDRMDDEKKGASCR